MAQFPNNRIQAVKWPLIIFLLLYAALDYYDTMSKPLIVDDDYAWLYSGWSVASGGMLYRDVFEFHPPLTTYIAAIPFSISNDVTSAILLHKFILFLFNIGIVATVFLLGRDFFSDEAGGLLAAAIYALGSEIVVFKTIFAALNMPTTFFILLGIYFFTKHLGQEKAAGHLPNLFLSGIFFSLALLSNQRAIAAFLPALLFLPFRNLACAHKAGAEARKEHIISGIKETIPLALGAMPIPLLLIAYLAWNSALVPFLALVGGSSGMLGEYGYLDIPRIAVTSAELFLTNAHNAPFLWPLGALLLAAYAAKYAYGLHKRRDDEPSDARVEFLAFFSVLFAALTLLLVRSEFTHVLFPLYPILALFAAAPVRDALESARLFSGPQPSLPVALLALFLTGTLLLPFAESYHLHTSPLYRDIYGPLVLEQQMNFTRYLNAITGPQDKLFGNAAWVSRRSAYFYSYNGLGGNEAGLVDALMGEKVKVISGPTTQAPAFISSNYVLDKQCSGTPLYNLVAGRNFNSSSMKLSGCTWAGGLAYCPAGSNASAQGFFIAEGEYGVWVSALPAGSYGSRISASMDGRKVGDGASWGAADFQEGRGAFIGKANVSQGNHTIALLFESGDFVLNGALVRLWTPEGHIC